MAAVKSPSLFADDLRARKSCSCLSDRIYMIMLVIRNLHCSFDEWGQTGAEQERGRV